VTKLLTKLGLSTGQLSQSKVTKKEGYWNQLGHCAHWNDEDINGKTK